MGYLKDDFGVIVSSLRSDGAPWVVRESTLNMQAKEREPQHGLFLENGFYTGDQKTLHTLYQRTHLYKPLLIRTRF